MVLTTVCWTKGEGLYAVRDVTSIVWLCLARGLSVMAQRQKIRKNKTFGGVGYPMLVF